MLEAGSKNELLLRAYLVLLIFIGCAATILWRIVDISIIEGDEWRDRKEKKGLMEWRPVPTQRGDIYADDGASLLATSVEFFDIRMDPVTPSERDFYENIEGLCRSLADYPGGRSYAQWRSYIVGARKACKQKKSGCSKYLIIANSVDYDAFKKLSSYPLFSKGVYKGGFIKEKQFKRKKPYADLASRSIGEYRDQNMVGLENSFDESLRGEEKKAYMQRLPGGLYVPVYDPTDFELCKGQDIVTTINVPLQDVVHHELKKGMVENEAEAAVAILMEVSTGRIKAISNLSRASDGSIGEYHNIGIADKSEPGSTIKAASVLALLEDGLADAETIVDFNYGRKKFYNLEMKDSGNHGLKYGSLQTAFEKSSNVGIASVMQDQYGSTGKQSLYYQKMMQFGFDAPTGVDVKGEPKPFIKNPKTNKDWNGTTIPWMAHGYELSMTPLQMLNFYNAIANGGVLMQPQMVKEIRYNDKTVKKFAPVVKRSKIASRENIEVLQGMLEGVVEKGTGRNMRSDSYDFAGKTGTTKVGYGTGEDERYNASFAGYWPADNPKYSMIVVVYGLRGAKYYGNVVAGPIFRRVVDWSFALREGDVAEYAGAGDFDDAAFDGELYGYGRDFDKVFSEVSLDYHPSGRWVKGGNGEKGDVVSVKAKISSEKIPDLEGMGLRDAVYVLENLGLKVDTRGAGKVVKQSILPGSKIDYQEITLYLN